MSTRLKGIARGAARRVATAPVRFLAPRLRAEAVEALSSQMIVDTEVSPGVLSFFAPSRLLQDRASTVMTKEPDMIHWIDGFSNDAVLWDIGANVGVFSLYAGFRRRCTVLAFEPSA